MSWNNNFTSPNWAGNDNATSGGSDVGNLYIVPDPPSITENPSIGLEERNEVPLPTKYLDMEVANLTATNIDAEDITTTNLTADDITATTINGNPNFDASNWSLFRAISDVRGTLGLFSVPQFSILDFLNITCTNSITSTGGSVTAALNVDAGVRCSAPLGSFNTVNAESVQVSATNETASVDVYGANLLAGNNALYVEGGTTLTGGGVVHGTTIGALQVAGIDTVRIDVLPAGMTLTSATFIATTAAGAASLVAGGALALAGGSYISYNSDQHYFTNTSAGNDFTDIYVGNIHAADGGSAPLRINDAGRGVELADVKSMTMTTQLAGVIAWSNATSYVVGNKVSVGSGIARIYYNCVSANKNLPPNAPIPNWVSASNYVVGNVVFSAGLVYRCLVNVSGSTTAPASDPTNWANLGFTTNAITQFWVVYSPYVANIIGDDVSNITIGKITAPVDFVRVAGSGLQGITQFEGLSGFNYLELVAQDGSSNSLAFLNSSAVLQAQISSNNGDGKLLIQSDTGLTINTTGATTTNFSGKDVENVKTLTLTSTIASPWGVATPYANGDEVEYDGGNWVSQFGVNQQNIPSATLENWNTSGFYAIGAVRYYATDNNAYRCILGVFGTTMPTPDTDPSHWSVFQVGSNGEDVWFPTTAPVVSAIIGDRVSGLQIGTIACVSDGGSYLEMSPDPENDANGIVQSAGALGLIGDQGVQIAAANSDVNVISLTGGVQLLSVDGGVAINGNTLIGLEASVGGVVINANTDVDITATQDATIQALNGTLNIGSAVGATTIESGTTISITGATGVSIDAEDDIDITTTIVGDVNITAADNINLTAGAGDKVIVNSTLDLTNKNVINANTITGQGALTLATTGATNLNLSPATGGVIVGNKNISMATINAITNCIGMSSDNALAFTANNGAVNLTATGAGNRINLNSDASLGNRTLFNFTGTNVGGIYGLTTQPLALVGQQATPQIHLRGATQMWLNSTTQAPGNSISGVTTLNGRNIFSYGNFYNTATQTLGAINTATRIQMNTSANNNLITLDTTTNIGRLTFTNAGVYQVSWSAYLFHGSGGAAKSVIWIRLNGTDVAGSGKTENNDSQLNETNLASTSLVNATAGQYIEFYWASDHTTVPLTAVAASAPYPATPSFACSITIVG